MVVSAALAGPSYAGDVDHEAERRSFSLLNAERGERGQRAMVWKDDLARVARDHSQRMADDGDISHNGGLGNQIDDWEALGENVGTGSDADTLHDMFMDSASHRNNILGSFREVGVGVVEQDGAIWLTQVFRTPTDPEQVVRKADRSPGKPTSHRRSYVAANLSDPIRFDAPQPKAAPKPGPRPVRIRALDMLDRMSAAPEQAATVSAYCRRQPRDC